MIDARKDKRYPIYATAVVKTKSRKSGARHEAQETMVAIANISKSGLGLYSFSSMRKGSSVSLDITLTSDGGEKLRDTVKGKVVWLSRKGSLYFIGIAFDEYLSQEKQPHLYGQFMKITSID